MFHRSKKKKNKFNTAVSNPGLKRNRSHYADPFQGRSRGDGRQLNSAAPAGEKAQDGIPEGRERGQSGSSQG
jgi:hypothetical protein